MIAVARTPRELVRTILPAAANKVYDVRGRSLQGVFDSQRHASYTKSKQTQTLCHTTSQVTALPRSTPMGISGQRTQPFVSRVKRLGTPKIVGKRFCIHTTQQRQFDQSPAEQHTHTSSRGEVGGGEQPTISRRRRGGSESGRDGLSPLKMARAAAVAERMCANGSSRAIASYSIIHSLGAWARGARF